MKTLLLLWVALAGFAQTPTPMLPEQRPDDLRIFFSLYSESPFQDIQLQVYGSKAVWNRTIADFKHTHGERLLTTDDLDHLYRLLKAHHVDKMHGNPVKGAAASLEVSWNAGQSKILLVNLDAYSVGESYRKDWNDLVERLRIFHRWAEGEK